MGHWGLTIAGLLRGGAAAVGGRKMSRTPTHGLPAEAVFVARAPEPRYGACAPEHAPELPGGVADTTSMVALRALLRDAGLDAARFGTPEWNPLSDVIAPGDRVLVKPNWVVHRNHLPGAGTECLVTHTDVLDALVRYAVRARPAEVVVGDAPVQGCDWDALRAACGLDAFAARAQALAAPHGVRVRMADFRRVVLPGGRLDRREHTAHRGDDDYVLFDLGRDSALEPVTREGTEFRVTMYDPHALRRTHAPGVHRYLVAREAVDAQVVLNVPKLKCHKKAANTGALKNLVGINGHKEYLPHHRKGGSERGGDCYGGSSRLKGFVENVLDHANQATSRPARVVLPLVAVAALRAGRAAGLDANVEGSWHGNDTVWRMCLDLQRILHYGRPDGSLADTVQRRVITLTDAVVAGEGDGPLSPSPVPLGVLTLAASTAAAEWVHAWLMGFDPARIPLTRQAWAPAPHPLAAFGPDDVRVVADGAPVDRAELMARLGRRFRPPSGWAGSCELADPAVEAAC
jgi:uncharacterized protein (DUF362 family)